ncbi:hypothetical protein [Helicobacter sp. 23-1045]
MHKIAQILNADFNIDSANFWHRFCKLAFIARKSQNLIFYATISLF